MVLTNWPCWRSSGWLKNSQSKLGERSWRGFLEAWWKAQERLKQIVCARTINMKRFISCSHCLLFKCELNECWPAFYLSFNFTLFYWISVCMQSYIAMSQDAIQMLIKWWGNCKSLLIGTISSFSMNNSVDPSLPHDVRAFDPWRRKRCDRWYDIELKQQKGHFSQSLLLKSCYGNWNEWKLEDGWINGVNKTGHKSRQSQEKEGRQAK